MNYIFFLQNINGVNNIIQEKSEAIKTYHGSRVGQRKNWIISSGKKGVIKNKKFNIIAGTTHENSINTSPRFILQKNNLLGSQNGIFIIRC